MRHLARQITVGVIALGSLGNVDGNPARRTWQEPSALRAVYQALGGSKRVHALRSLILHGTVRVGFDGWTGLLRAERKPLTIMVLLPDYYLRVERDQFTESRFGHSRDTLLNADLPLAPNAGISGSVDPGRLDFERRKCALLVLGMVMYTKAAMPLRLRSAKADLRSNTMEVSGPSGFRGFVDIDETHLPVRIRYESTLRFPRPMTDAEKRAKVIPPATPPVRCELALTFEERRVVDGLYLPHRIRRVAKGVTFEDIALDRIEVNPPLSPKDFVRQDPRH